MSGISVRGELALDGSGWDRTLRKGAEGVEHLSHETLDDLKSAIAGAFTLDALVEFSKSTIEYGEHVADLSRQLGISTDAVQEWDYAMQKSGATMDTAAKFFEQLAVSREKVFEGGAEAAKMIGYFDQLGVSVDDLKSKRLEDIAAQISDVFKSGDPQNLMAALRDVGGRGAGDMLGAMRDGIREAADEAERLGLVIDTNVIGSLKRSGDQWKILMAEVRAGYAPLLAGFLEGWDRTVSMVSARFQGVLSIMDYFRNGGKADFHSVKTLYQQTRNAEYQSQDEEEYKLNHPKQESFKRKPVLGPPAPDDETTNKTKKLLEELHAAELQSSLVGLPYEEKRNKLIEERATLLEKIKSESGDDKIEDQIKISHLTQEIKEMETRAAELSPHDVKEPTSRGRGIRDADSLVRVGNLVGDNGRGMTTAAQHANQLTAQTNRILAEMLAFIKTGKGKFTPMEQSYLKGNGFAFAFGVPGGHY